ncbi:Threonine efflux protein [Ephemeroptericola cinctiostellae]|uniref:Threonine efflux protein n=1 Tax=Ephemeroptericola cinctiostellae TaxID=2268024 RepID=A0A345D8F8_9BURK|nr:Threonine efflux protein [Ephemeroptericola cinctiostellae]
MQELLSVTLITILAVISPGADFALVTRNSFTHGRTMGLWTTLGIGVGVQIHVFYTMVGVGIVIATQPAMLSALKIVGAVYLIYIGYQTFRGMPATSINDTQSSSHLSPCSSL